LPRNVHVLGVTWGVGFVLLNLPVNYYAGSILSHAALFVEAQQGLENEEFLASKDGIENSSLVEKSFLLNESTASQGVSSNKRYDTMMEDPRQHSTDPTRRSSSLHHDTATFDFIGMTSALFPEPSNRATRWVMLLFYTNIFLVLGDYILVMSHAVVALSGDVLCIPVAGALASTLMFAVCQLRTMSHLGRSASIVSLTALFLVVLQCLYYANNPPETASLLDDNKEEDYSIFRKLSAMGSIGFAVGSQKLFLNIRHELADRTTAPTTLAGSLSAFGTFYIAVVLAAGSSKFQCDQA